MLTVTLFTNRCLTVYVYIQVEHNFVGIKNFLVTYYRRVFSTSTVSRPLSVFVPFFMKITALAYFAVNTGLRIIRNITCSGSPNCFIQTSTSEWKVDCFLLRISCRECTYFCEDLAFSVSLFCNMIMCFYFLDISQL